MDKTLKLGPPIQTTIDHLYKLINLYDCIKSRCEYPSSSNYKYYGKISIRMCPLWKQNRLKFILFCLKHGWRPGLQIDRIDNDLGYYPSNVRFSSATFNKGHRGHGNKSTGFGGRRFSKLPLNVTYDRRVGNQKKPYICVISREAHRVYVGRFHTIAEAVRARNKAIKKLERQCYGKKRKY